MSSDSYELIRPMIPLIRRPNIVRKSRTNQLPKVPIHTYVMMYNIYIVNCTIYTVSMMRMIIISMSIIQFTMYSVHCILYTWHTCV